MFLPCMLRRSIVYYSEGGGLLEKLVPGYQEKIWSRVPKEWKLRKIQMDHASFESFVNKHKSFQEWFLKYKQLEQRFAPSEKFRKPAVDWRRQLARGTLHFGKGIEGPYGTDYRPGNTFDRLKQMVPFTPEEWAKRKEYRVWDGMKFGFLVYGLFIAHRLLSDTPVVWA